MQLFLVLSALVAIGSSAPKDIASESLTHNDVSEVSQTVIRNSDDITEVTSDKVHGDSHGEDAVLAPRVFYGILPSNVLNINRRSLFDWLKKSFPRYHGNTKAQTVVSGEDFGLQDSSAEQTETLVKSKPQSAPLPSPAVPALERNDITYVGDTDVNYIGVQPRDNPDAEVFDINLVREDANRFFARRPQPMRSQPMRLQPMRSQPMRFQPMRSQPMKSKPMRSQPMMSQPMRSQPMRSQPIKSSGTNRV